jgi:hypothetical protein
MFATIAFHDQHTNVRHYARACFDRFHQQGWKSQLWCKLVGHQEALQNLHEVAQADTVQTRRHAGVRLVPIDQIRGSEGRCEDFDRSFRPLKRLSDERWISIFCAQDADVPLPLVELIQVNDLYFVRDGHHRISVARWLGQKEIEAEVTVWHGREVKHSGQGAATTTHATTIAHRHPRFLPRLVQQAGESLVAAVHKVQALVAPPSERPVVQGS